MTWIAVQPYFFLLHVLTYYKNIIRLKQKDSVMDSDSQIKDLIESTRSIFNEIKINYTEFLSSLKYQNLSDKKKSKANRKKIQELPGSEGWENLMSKNFSFEDEIVNQNGGMACFLKLIENIKKLEEVNYQLSLKLLVEDVNNSKEEQIESTIDMLAFIEKGLLTSLAVQPREMKKQPK